MQTPLTDEVLKEVTFCATAPTQSVVLTQRPLTRRVNGGGGRIRTFEGLRQQIYSLSPLTAWVPHLGLS